jgi:phage minor structural protein
MANPNIIQVYNRNRERLAFLQNAFNIGYRKTLNSLWTASFSMPADDTKNAHCKPFNLVELYDDMERVELFRIIGEDLTRSTQATTVYNCEHVLATLIDDVMFQYHQIGNIGVNTTAVLRYVLDRQTTKNWKLGMCDFTRFFEYKWENENLLSALFSIAKPFTEGYIWEFDTAAYPWTLNLRKLSGEVKSEIRYGKNMAEITKTVDAANVITRLYCLGYGEGVYDI